MERLHERLTLARRALDRLCELTAAANPSKVERDAAIQRFEYTFEAVWKACQRLLRVREGIDVGPPKACIRAARDAGLLSEGDTEWALVMADDRNLTAHTYDEALAEAIMGRLVRHAAVLGAWVTAMQPGHQPT